ncbi:MAG TPA: aminomethyl-transferring glycine dehydrogenase subunit GcvPB [Spirochaetota bacterium]|nr:aminomethyl-transferring glycine dehydrogenase subunit GcvPB [Spirochaetota bacterium]HPJ34452.1 aminomethyl-transferring glycine dehydrogenase subunit GcvPB [Spirochaetota bacterium]
MNVELIFEKSSPGQNRYRLPEPEFGTNISIPEKLIRDEIPLPDCGEPEVVRHYNNLSRMNFGVDNGMYPLGSCTMKYNPKINERLSRNPSFSGLHPFADDANIQGALRILYELSEYLSLITGLKDFTLSPAAGSHGELTGVMVIKKYFESRNDRRGTILIPDSAHGTNPASVAMCGFKVREVPSNSSGDVDLDKFLELLDEDVAAMMLTCPNTLGLFDRNITVIAEALHKNGSLFYADGANLNALVGRVRFSDIGFDLMHINLHKTFSTPHGGGGPGSGPLGAAEHLVEFLPIPAIRKEGKKYITAYDRPQTIGRVHSFFGNFAICLRAYIYIRMLGYNGLREVSDTAVLNANYLMSKLKDIYNLPIDRRCMHEFVLNDKGLPNGITTNDISKRILDYGFHSPTVYFPLLVHGAMMIEPTETESFASLERFIEIMKKIRIECDNEPEKILGAPCQTPVGRVDTVLAAKKPVLKWGD